MFFSTARVCVCVYTGTMLHQHLPADLVKLVQYFDVFQAWVSQILVVNQMYRQTWTCSHGLALINFNADAVLNFRLLNHYRDGQRIIYNFYPRSHCTDKVTPPCYVWSSGDGRINPHFLINRRLRNYLLLILDVPCFLIFASDAVR